MNALALEGVLFAANRFRKPSRSAIAVLYGERLADSEAGGSSGGGSAGKGGYGAVSSATSFQADGSAAASARSAYTDL